MEDAMTARDNDLIPGDMVRIRDAINEPDSPFFYEPEGIVLRVADVLSPTCTLYAVARLDPREDRPAQQQQRAARRPCP